MNFFLSSAKSQPQVTINLFHKGSNSSSSTNNGTVDIGSAREPAEKVKLEEENEVQGEVEIVSYSSVFPHTGVYIELVGQMEFFNNKSNIYTFFNLNQMLSPPGNFVQGHEQKFPFLFRNFGKKFDSYDGKNAKIRYFIRVTISTSSSFFRTIKEHDIWVVKKSETTETTPENGILERSTAKLDDMKAKDKTLKDCLVKMEVGIEDCLHIEFEFNKKTFTLDDIVIGNVKFVLVRIKLKSMELGLIRKEQVATPKGPHTETETLYKIELMQGDVVKGEVIPVRMFLSGLKYFGHNHPDEKSDSGNKKRGLLEFDNGNALMIDTDNKKALSPTYEPEELDHKFSVKYFLNLILLDESDRRYFKQQEIILTRR